MSIFVWYTSWVKQLLFLFVWSILFIPAPAQAIIPPDLLVSVGAQFAQMFSFFAFVIGGLFMSVMAGLSPYVFWIKKHLRALLVGIFLVCVGFVGATFYVQHQTNQAMYQERIAELEAQLLPSNTQLKVVEGETFLPGLDTTVATDSGRQFRSNTLFFTATGSEPFYLELDLNRKQNPNGTFLHYYYLHGFIDGEDIVEYTTFTSNSSFPKPDAFLKSFTVNKAADASTRRSYQGTVVINGDEISFDTEVFKGDFVTKDAPDYTRFQSIQTADITHSGNEITAQAVYETVYSEDFSVSIFYPGQEDLESITYQFMLWDENGNYYLFDNTQVFSETPEYPSHTWLIHKNAAEATTRKSYTAQFSTDRVLDRDVQWEIGMPDFSNAVVSLQPTHEIDKGGLQSRDRTLVSGVITDDKGTREVFGFLHYLNNQ